MMYDLNASGLLVIPERLAGVMKPGKEGEPERELAMFSVVIVEWPWTVVMWWMIHRRPAG